MSRKGTVLVIEDDEDLARGLVEWMMLQEIEAVIAADATEASDLLGKGLRPCVIVLDLGLPVVDGAEFLRIRRGIDPDVGRIPVIILTGTDATLGDFAHQGVVGVFRKPGELSLVVELVRDLCGRK